MRREGRKVYLEDDGHGAVYVGQDCWAHVQHAGRFGYRPPRGGPKLFATPQLAKDYLDLTSKAAS